VDTDEHVLWRQWRSDRNGKARNALISLHSQWSRLVARDVYLRVRISKDAWHDCTQNALIGLIEAIDRFDPDRKVPFQSFARHRVRGAVFDGLRSLYVGTISTQGAQDTGDILRERIESLGEHAIPDPIEEFVSITVGLGLGMILDMQSMPGYSAPSDAYAKLESEQLSTALALQVAKLPERDRLILNLHYYHHVPFVDIAEELRITKGRVSQLHKRALDRLRQELRRDSSVDY
jgi:RNA polymerase sigma factor for flagellar operon FliA